MKNPSYLRFEGHASCYLPHDIPNHMGHIALQALDAENALEIIRFLGKNSVAANTCFWQLILEAPQDDAGWERRLKEPHAFDSEQEYVDNTSKFREKVEIVRKLMPNHMQRIRSLFQESRRSE